MEYVCVCVFVSQLRPVFVYPWYICVAMRLHVGVCLCVLVTVCEYECVCVCVCVRVYVCMCVAVCSLLGDEIVPTELCSTSLSPTFSPQYKACFVCLFSRVSKMGERCGEHR